MEKEKSLWKSRYNGLMTNKAMLVERLGRTHLDMIIDALLEDKEALNYPQEVAILLETKKDFQRELAYDRDVLINYYLTNLNNQNNLAIKRN